jgi:hypothetical protein
VILFIGSFEFVLNVLIGMVLNWGWCDGRLGLLWLSVSLRVGVGKVLFSCSEFVMIINNSVGGLVWGILDIVDVVSVCCVLFGSVIVVVVKRIEYSAQLFVLCQSGVLSFVFGGVWFRVSLVDCVGGLFILFISSSVVLYSLLGFTTLVLDLVVIGFLFFSAISWFCSSIAAASSRSSFDASSKLFS